MYVQISNCLFDLNCCHTFIAYNKYINYLSVQYIY